METKRGGGGVAGVSFGRIVVSVKIVGWLAAYSSSYYAQRKT